MLAAQFWQAVIFRAARMAVYPDQPAFSIKKIWSDYADPEDMADEMKDLDGRLSSAGKVLIVTFDALDTVSRHWNRSTKLIDALLEVIWSLRVRRAIRAKVFIRPEQLNDENLRFIELPKLRSSAVQLEWSQT